MLKIPLADIKSGMKLVKDVVLPDGRLLLLAGFIIKPVYLKKLESFNIDFVYVDESPYEHVEEFNEEKLHNKACKAIKTLMYSIREGDTVDMDIINNSVSDIVNAVMDNDAVMMQTTGIRDIEKNANIIFDPYITDIFIANIGTYADGTMVLLNTGEVGIIIKSPADNNRKLKINVISSKNGPPVLRPYIVDLEANPGIEILEVYN